MQIAGMKKQAAHALLQLERGGTVSRELDDDVPEMMVSFIEHRRRKVTMIMTGTCPYLVFFTIVMVLWKQERAPYYR